jgi:hypothetical protein
LVIRFKLKLKPRPETYPAGFIILGRRLGGRLAEPLQFFVDGRLKSLLKP